MRRPLLIVAFVAFSAWWIYDNRTLSHPPGVLVPEEPLQSTTSGDAPVFEKNGYRITPLARFAVHGRVLGAEHYHFGRESDLSPVDLALGWGPMSDTAVLEQLSISQSGRFYFYRWSHDPPIPQHDIVTHSANMHLIPADSAVARQLNRVRPGHLVQLAGWLVRVDASDGWRWVSSLTREDSGDGACELIWVESAEVSSS